MWNNWPPALHSQYSMSTHTGDSFAEAHATKTKPTRRREASKFFSVSRESESN